MGVVSVLFWHLYEKNRMLIIPSAIQILVEKVRNILWVSQGALGDKPYSNMMHGVARCLLHERSDSRFQMIDVDTSEKPDPQFISETLMRLHISDTWTKKLAIAYKPQWSFEREIYIMKGGDMRIPRYSQSSELDDRYNSARRLVRSQVQMEKTVVEILSSGSSFDIGEYIPSVAEENLAEDFISIRLSRSFLVKGAGLSILDEVMVTRTFLSAAWR